MAFRVSEESAHQQRQQLEAYARQKHGTPTQRRGRRGKGLARR